MRRFFQIFLPLVVIAIAALMVKVIVSNPTKPKTRKVEIPPVFVEVQLAKQSNFPVKVITQGEAAPRISSKIIPEVSGKVISVSDNFFSGRFFKKDEILIQIDPRDYQISLSKAKADLVKAETALVQERIRTANFKTAIINGQNTLQRNILSLKEEKAKAEQALIDWKRLGREGQPSELVLRKPQLEAAKAAVESAKADIEKAKRDLTLIDPLLKNSAANVESAKAEVKQREIDLERCTIKAPFNGRIISKSVNVGQYTSPGNSIADIYGIDYAEVRLPITAADLKFMSLPDDTPGSDSPKPKVTLSLNNGVENVKWHGILDRTESRMDPKSRQHHVIAQVEKPFSKNPALKPGVFVKAEIIGKTISEVFILPISSIRESSYVWLVSEKSELKKQAVDIVWRNMEIAVVKGLKEGDKICTTTLTFARNGLPVIEKGKKKK